MSLLVVVVVLLLRSKRNQLVPTLVDNYDWEVHSLTLPTSPTSCSLPLSYQSVCDSK